MSSVSRASQNRTNRRTKAANPAQASNKDFSVGWISERLGAAERRQVTVLSCGLAAQTGTGENLDPEELADRLVLFRRIFDEMVDRYGGAGERGNGPMALAYWGYPHAVEEPERLAVLAALDIACAGTAELGIRCAVDTGLMIAGYDQSTTGPQVIGTAVQQAKLLQMAGPPGSVLVSSAVARMITSAFELEPQAAEAGGSLRVLHPRRDWRRACGAESVDVVGLEVERHTVDRLWDGVLAYRPQCLVVTGEAGIGKTTLLRHLKAQAEPARDKWIEVQCLPELSRAPLAAVRAAIVRLLGDGGLGGCEDLAPLKPPDRELLEIFLRVRNEANLKNGAAASAQVPRPGHLYEVLAELVTALALRDTVVMTFEDLHWADEATLELIAVLLDRLGGLGRFCLALTWRSGTEPVLRIDRPHTTLALSRLKPSGVDTLLTQSPLGVRLPAEIRLKIARRSEGVPLFALELARLWAAGIPAAESDALLEPGPLNSILAARLDCLGELKPLAQAAAVIGPEFDLTTLAAVLEMEAAQLASGLAVLAESGFLILQDGSQGAYHCRFAHALLRDAAYASVLKSRRQDLHRRAAEVLSRDDTPAAGRRPEVVASHFAEAGDFSGAFRWWVRAGEAAAEISSVRAAVYHFQQALAVRRQDAAVGSLEDEARVQRMLGMQLAALRGNGAPEVVEALERSIALSPSPGADQFDALWALHACCLVRGEIGRALKVGRELIESLDERQPDERHLRAHRVQGLAELLAGRLGQAFSHYRLVLDLYDETWHAPLRFKYTSDQGAISYAQLAWGEAVAGASLQSTQHARAALELSARLRHPHTSAHVACVLAARAQALGELHTASALAYVGRTLGDRHEFPYWSAWADIIHGWVEGSRDGAAGMVLIRRAIQSYAETGACQALPYASLLLAKTALAAEKPQQALGAAVEGLALANQHGVQLHAAALLSVKAQALHRLRADPMEVRRLLIEAEALANRQGAHLFAACAQQLSSIVAESN